MYSHTSSITIMAKCCDLLQGEEFLYHATEVKNIWIPMGEVFAN